MAGANRPSAAGFALIEILVAFTIGVLALGLLYQASSDGLKIGGAAARYHSALLIAESTLDAVGVEAPLASRDTMRRVDGGYDQHVSVRPRPDLSPPAGDIPGAFPYEIAVDMTWREAGRVRSIELSTIRLGSVP